MTESVENATAGTPTVGSSLLKSLKWLLGLGGALALIIGLLILLEPTRTAITFTMIVAAYALLAGIFYIVIAFASKGMPTSGRIGHGLAGVVFIVAAIMSFMNPGPTTVLLAAIVVIFIGMSWIFEGVAALTTLKLAPSKGWAIFFAIVSILAGTGLLLSPLFAGAVLWMWFGISLVVIGIVQIVRAFTIGKG